MTIKEVAARAGLSHQAIYKRIKARGVRLDSIRDKATGALTAEGEALMRELFDLEEEPREVPEMTQAAAPEEEPEADAAEVEKLRNQVEKLQGEVEKLTTEVEKLRNQVATHEEKERALTDERDFLRLSLERSQQLQAITAAKIPNPPPALQAGQGEPVHGLRAWLQRLRNRGKPGA